MRMENIKEMIGKIYTKRYLRKKPDSRMSPQHKLLRRISDFMDTGKNKNLHPKREKE
jgi:hypothetical protein